MPASKLDSKIMLCADSKHLLTVFSIKIQQFFINASEFFFISLLIVPNQFI